MAYNFMMNQKNNFNSTASDLFDVDAGTAAVQEQANNVSTEASNMWEGLNQQYEDKMAELNITGIKDLTESGGEIGLSVANFAVTKLTGQGIAAWGSQGAKYLGGKISGLFGDKATPLTTTTPAVSPTDPTIAPTTTPETVTETTQTTTPLDTPITGSDAMPSLTSTTADFTNPAFGLGPREVVFNNPAFDTSLLPDGAGPISSAPGADFMGGGDIGAPMRAAMSGRQAGGPSDQAANTTANGSDSGLGGGVNNEADLSFSGTQSHGGGLAESTPTTTADLEATPTPAVDPVPDAIDPVVEETTTDTVATTALETEAVVAGAAAETGVLAPLAIGIVAIGGLIEGILSLHEAPANKPAPPPPVPDVSAGAINTGGLAQSFQAGI
jgi:hypothetical protein